MPDCLNLSRAPPTRVRRAVTYETVDGDLKAWVTLLDNESDKFIGQSGLAGELNAFYHHAARFAESAQGGQSSLAKSIDERQLVNKTRETVFGHYRYGTGTRNRKGINDIVKRVSTLASIDLVLDPSTCAPGSTYQVPERGEEWRYWQTGEERNADDQTVEDQNDKAGFRGRMSQNIVPPPSSMGNRSTQQWTA